MSNFNQNNKRTNNKERNFNDHNKVARQPKVNPNEFKAQLFLPASLSESIKTEILDVLAKTKFNKISIPVGTYRYLIESNIDADDARVCTIGYIRGYNAETEEFTLVVFSKFTDIIKSLGDIAIDLQFTQYKEKLGTITKFNILPVLYDEEDEQAESEE